MFKLELLAIGRKFYLPDQILSGKKSRKIWKMEEVVNQTRLFLSLLLEQLIVQLFNYNDIQKLIVNIE